MKKFIKVTFQVEGIHRWKECPIPEMFYLKDWHRHMFYFEVEMSVTELDREVEFIQLKNELQTFGDNLLCNPVELSCEAMAAQVFEYLEDKYGPRRYKIYVAEDGENGGGVESE